MTLFGFAFFVTGFSGRPEGHGADTFCPNQNRAVDQNGRPGHAGRLVHGDAREGPASAEDSQADVALANDFLPLSKGDAFSFDAPNGQKVTMRFLKSQG